MTCFWVKIPLIITTERLIRYYATRTGKVIQIKFPSTLKINIKEKSQTIINYSL
jgi:hypothetical protein